MEIVTINAMWCPGCIVMHKVWDEIKKEYKDIKFNSYDYESASLNRICKRGEISKGIIYHYFKDKDDLYLKCVQKCFETLIDYYNQKNFDCPNLSEAVIEYMQVRARFFEEHVEFGGLFGYAPIMPVNKFSCDAFINRGGRIPAPIHSFKN